MPGRRNASLKDPELYEEVETDRSATWQAVATVALTSVAAGVGLGIGGALVALGALRSQIYGVAPGDTLSLAAAVLGGSTPNTPKAN